MCWCKTCIAASNDVYDNRICPCGEESPCLFHGGIDPYAASATQAGGGMN